MSSLIRRFCSFQVTFSLFGGGAGVVVPIVPTSRSHLYVISCVGSVDRPRFSSLIHLYARQRERDVSEDVSSMTSRERAGKTVLC